MGPKAAYGEKLKDPRWQKKRLRIFDRDGWSCLLCKSTSQTLHVHHLKYEGDPWEVNDKFLMTLCSECHDFMHKVEYTEDSVQKELVMAGALFMWSEIARCLVDENADIRDLKRALSITGDRLWDFNSANRLFQLGRMKIGRHFSPLAVLQARESD